MVTVSRLLLFNGTTYAGYRWFSVQLLLICTCSYKCRLRLLILIHMVSGWGWPLLLICYLLGDQYFDKAMNGFMKELFGKIKVAKLYVYEYCMCICSTVCVLGLSVQYCSMYNTAWFFICRRMTAAT